MRLGFVLTSYVYLQDRVDIVTKSFESLIKTKTDFNPIIQLILHPSAFNYDMYIKELTGWEVIVKEDEPGRRSWDTVVIQGAEELLAASDITHIGFLPDDFLYHPDWLIQLYALIERHPTATAWSVYRSAFTRHHRIIGGDGTDVLMSMHDAVGTMTRQEWKDYDAVNRIDFTCPENMGGGCTMDIHHAYIRPGYRWATSRDYWQNLGVHVGLEGKDCAIDFVGDDNANVN